MSDFTKAGHQSFIAEAQRLLAAIEAAKNDPEARDLAEHDMAVFMRLNQQGRLKDWFTSTQERAPR